jgi:hypothetical protein
LLEAVGPTFATPLSLYRTPLGRVLPGEPSGSILEQGYRPTLTELGWRHPVTADLPDAGSGATETPAWGRWFRQIEAHPTRGVVVMDGAQGRPLLILDRVGEGRVAQFLSDHMWLWSRGFEGGGPQAELLRRVAHWLMREPDLEEEDLRASVVGGQLEVVRRSLAQDLPEIEVTFYRVSDGEKTALAAVGPLNPIEFEDLRATAELLNPLIEESRGAVVRLAGDRLPSLRKVKPGRDRHGRGWIGVQAQGGYVVTGVLQVPLLPAALVLLLALGSALLAWWREGH